MAHMARRFGGLHLPDTCFIHFPTFLEPTIVLPLHAYNLHDLTDWRSRPEPSEVKLVVVAQGSTAGP